MANDEMIEWVLTEADARDLGPIELVVIDVVTPPFGCVEVDSFWMEGLHNSEHLVTLYRKMTDEELVTSDCEMLDNLF